MFTGPTPSWPPELLQKPNTQRSSWQSSPRHGARGIAESLNRTQELPKKGRECHQWALGHFGPIFRRDDIQKLAWKQWALQKQRLHLKSHLVGNALHHILFCENKHDFASDGPNMTKPFKHQCKLEAQCEPMLKVTMSSFVGCFLSAIERNHLKL